MTLLIDGYNLLWVFPPLRKQMIDRNSEEARRGLVSLLTQLVRNGRIRDHVSVVFDGRSSPGSRSLSVPGVLDVHFAPHPATADSMIVDMVAASNDPGEITVVTSDREVQSRSRNYGAAIMGVKKFLERHVPDRMVKRAGSSAPRSTDDKATEEVPDKPRAELGAFEVEKWLEEFGFDRDE